MFLEGCRPHWAPNQVPLSFLECLIITQSTGMVSYAWVVLSKTKVPIMLVGNRYYTCLGKYTTTIP